MKTIIAITRDGSEFVYKSSSVHSVPAKSAAKILDILNTEKYKLAHGEKWFIYSVPEWELKYSAASFQSFRFHSGRLYETIN